MDSWERFDETFLPSKEVFYNTLNMEDIADVDYRHSKRIYKEFSNKNMSDYHDLYIQSNALLFADIFKNSRNKCIEIYELDPAHFLSVPRLAWQAYLRKTGIKLELLTDFDMLLMVEKRITGGICHAIHRYAKVNNKYMKNYDKSKESPYIQYLDGNNLFGLAMSQKLPVEGFKWKKCILKFNKNFIKNYDEDSDKGYIIQLDVKYSKRLHNLYCILPFLPERMKINKCNKLACNLYDKKAMLFI